MGRRRGQGEVSSLAEGFGLLRSDYAAARDSRFRRDRVGVPSMGSGADYHYRNESQYLKLMELARDMDRNDCVVGTMLDQAVTGALQSDGIQPDPNTGDDALDQELLEKWWAWAEDPQQCDAAGEKCWAELEWLAFRQTLADGDIFALPLMDGALQLVEAHRCRTPSGTSRKNVVHGIVLDERRTPLEYWFTKDDIDPLAPLKLVGDVAKYPARDDAGNKQVFHVRDPKPRRISQTRGVTALMPIFDQLGMLEDINFAKLVQQQVASCYAVFRERDVDAPQDDDDEDTDENKRGAETDDQWADGTVRRITGQGPGMEVIGRPGEKLVGFSPNVPNPEFFEHMKLILTFCGINLGLPLVMLLMDAKETNFSGWRGAVDNARQGFRRNQRWLVGKFHRPVYQWKVREWAVESPTIRAAMKDGRAFKCEWKFPSWPYIEPLKDAQADELRDSSGQISLRRLHAEHGRDWDDLSTEIVADRAMAVRKAKTETKAINQEFGDDNDPVRWRDLMPLTAPGGVQVKSGEEPKPEPAIGAGGGK